MYRAIRSFLDQSVKQSSFLGRSRSLAIVFDNSYTVEFKSGRSAAVLRSPISRVSCDSLVFGSICETVVIFRSPEVARHCFLTTLTQLCSKVDDPLRF